MSPITLQASATTSIPLPPVALISLAADADMTRRNLRPLTLSRYGGPGSHRAPIGFSGDTLRKWDTLAYEVRAGLHHIDY